MALTGSEYGSCTTKGSKGSLNRLCIKKTANEYLARNVTNGYALTFSILEHNSNNANDPVKINGNSYHKKKLYALMYA